MEILFRQRPTPAPMVLIVDDDLAFVCRLRSGVIDAGYRPVWARDGREAMVAMTDEKPAVIVIAANLPKAAATELLARVDRSPALSRIPRVLLADHAWAAKDLHRFPRCPKALGVDALLRRIAVLIGQAATRGEPLAG